MNRTDKRDTFIHFATPGGIDRGRGGGREKLINHIITCTRPMVIFLCANRIILHGNLIDVHVRIGVFGLSVR